MKKMILGVALAALSASSMASDQQIQHSKVFTYMSKGNTGAYCKAALEKGSTDAGLESMSKAELWGLGYCDGFVRQLSIAASLDVKTKLLHPAKNFSAECQAMGLRLLRENPEVLVQDSLATDGKEEKMNMNVIGRQAIWQFLENLQILCTAAVD